MNRSRPPCPVLPPARRQRGGMSVTMMLVMLGLVTMLGLVEIGYLYWAKRDVQKIADLSALAGAQRLDLCTANRADNAAARSNALTANRFPGTLQVSCGVWNPTHASADHFIGTAPAPVNAVKVIAERPVLPFFGQTHGLPQVRAQAVATRAPPLAVFSVGSQLLRVNGNTPLGGVLKLVGVDLDQTTLLGYDGLAQAKITPGGLLRALGIPVDANISVGDFNALLAAHKVSLGQLLDATASVLSQSGVAHVDMRALKDALAAKLDINQLNLQLGSNAAGSGLFGSIVAPDGPASAALQAEVNALDLITTSISIANGGRGVAVNNLSILGLVQAQTAVIEPPSIAIGGVGARAYNAQVRVKLDIDSNKLSLGLGKVLAALGIRLRLPVYADVTNAMGTLTGLQCAAQPATATIRVESSVLRACVGKVDAATQFSTRNVCDASLQNEQLLTLLGAPLINDQIKLNALTHDETVTLSPGETKSTWINGAQIGTAVNDLVRELLRVLSGMLNPASKGMGNADTANQLADQFLKAANPGNGLYDVDKTIALLRNGSSAQGIEAFGDWEVKDGVPYACGLLLLKTCYKDGSAWEGYRAVVTGQGLGVLDGLLGTVLGGLVINRCSGLVSTLLAYNSCVKGNLATYLQTAPSGMLDNHQGSGSVTDPGTNSVACSGLLCTLLRPVLEGLLKPVLNGVGTLLTQTLAMVLGLELGRTDVHLQAVQCNPAQLVY
ncbi:TadG family pilus assembly protein [Stenotrophomonas rhizophila]|uniref:TadG family pilus assembly protein n=1 Tax=Stenotrophomonas rhizophila TaxID=216778 RepID=UPI0028D1F825|nr:TadG family pilus assembly protein [Stenotrophomonas rhizophila]